MTGWQPFNLLRHSEEQPRPGCRRLYSWPRGLALLQKAQHFFTGRGLPIAPRLLEEVGPCVVLAGFHQVQCIVSASAKRAQNSLETSGDCSWRVLDPKFLLSTGLKMRMLGSSEQSAGQQILS